MIGNAAGSNTFVDEVDCGSFFDQSDDLLDFPSDDIDAAIPGGSSTSDFGNHHSSFLNSSFPSIWSAQSDSLPGSDSVFSNASGQQTNAAGSNTFVDEVDCGSFFDLLDFPSDDIDAAIPGGSSASDFGNHHSSFLNSSFPSIWSAQSESLPGSDSVFSNASGSDLSAELSVRDQFPVGMRVLAVDDDPICLKVLENLLRKCQYHVTTTNQAVTALKMLRENKSKYDLVISDVVMPDMDGFKLLELVRLEIDLPVILLSSNSDKDLVYKGVADGAVDYLLKPVRMEELKNIWQHVVRKERLFPRDPTRVAWSVDLHQKFVQAVDQLGLDKAVPKKILDLMNVEGLTEGNVASHLQKYRLYLTKLSNQSA